jgi:hypothetical protein
VARSYPKNNLKPKGWRSGSNAGQLPTKHGTLGSNSNAVKKKKKKNEKSELLLNK